MFGLKCPPLHLVCCNHWIHRNLWYWASVKRQLNRFLLILTAFLFAGRLLMAFSRVSALEMLVWKPWFIWSGDYPARNVLPIIFIPILMRNGNPKRQIFVTWVPQIEKSCPIKDIGSLFISRSVDPDERQCKVIWIIAAIGQSKLKKIMALASSRWFKLHMHLRFRVGVTYSDLVIRPVYT